MEFQLQMIDSNGVIVASTYFTADRKEEVTLAIEQLLDDADSGDSEWLDGLNDYEF
jgi:hypothetical protein